MTLYIVLRIPTTHLDYDEFAGKMNYEPAIDLITTNKEDADRFVKKHPSQWDTYYYKIDTYNLDMSRK